MGQLVCLGSAAVEKLGEPTIDDDRDADGGDGRTEHHAANLSQGAVPTAVPVQTVEFIPEIHGQTRTYEPGQLDLKSGDLELAPVRRPEGLPRMVAGYEVLGLLGRGGMGVVYKSRQPGLKRLVALKMILAAGHAGDDDIARFRSEAEAVALLKHPNIVQIHEIGEEWPTIQTASSGNRCWRSRTNGKRCSPHGRATPPRRVSIMSRLAKSAPSCWRSSPTTFLGGRRWP
jgi:hypothetical protein